MIYESKFWKDDLLKQAEFLQTRITQKYWTENSLAYLEQILMLGFYSIRKLIEARKLSDIVANQKITVRTYKNNGKPVTRLNWTSIDKLYELCNAKSVAKDLIFFCHQFVHSYIFLASFGENNDWDGVFINSDRERNQALYFIEIYKIVDLFEQTRNDYLTSIQYTENIETLDYNIQAWSHEPRNKI